MKETDWRGFRQLNFEVNGRESFIVCPKESLSEKPWVWRTEFFGAFDFADWELLHQGWHLAYTQCSDMYGCPESVRHFEDFYQVAVNEYRLHKRPSLFGFSRGALYAVQYALAHPDHCSSLYLDAPVLNLCSWPGGLGTGVGDPHCWNQLPAVFGYPDTETFRKEYRDHPLEHAEDLAATGLPVMIVYGDSDRIVPFEENALPFYNRFRAAGGVISMIGKRNCDHHPHSIIPSKPIEDFVTRSLVM